MPRLQSLLPTEPSKTACRIPAGAVLQACALIAAAVLPLPAAGHGGSGGRHWWTLDPWVWLPLLVLAGLYLRGLVALHARQRTPCPPRPAAIAAFCAGIAAAFLALISPLDALGETSFAAHMAQHMLLIMVAAPLLAMSEPALPLLAAMPSRWRRLNSRLGGFHRLLRVLSRPSVAFAVHGALIWLWHAPLLFEWALRWRWVHVTEHVAFFGSALLFWHALRKAGRSSGQGYGAAVLWTLATLIHTGLLGALITFAPRPLYPFYANGGGALSPMEDQQLAGLLMWIPAGVCYLIAGLGYAAASLRSVERQSRRQARLP